jgi:hypothetical protein
LEEILRKLDKIKSTSLAAENVNKDNRLGQTQENLSKMLQ